MKLSICIFLLYYFYYDRNSEMNESFINKKKYNLAQILI